MKWMISIVFLLCHSSTAHGQPLLITTDGDLSLDEIKYFGDRMHRTLTQLHVDTEYRNGSQITSDSDRALIRKAVTTAPHYLATLDVLEAGCEYFFSTERVQLSQARLAGFFVESEKESMKIKYEFMMSTYNALSEQAKSRIDVQAAYDAAELRRSGIGVPSAEETLQHYYQLDLETLIARYTDFCNGGLEESRQRLEDPNMVFRSRKL